MIPALYKFMNNYNKLHFHSDCSENDLVAKTALVELKRSFQSIHGSSLFNELQSQYEYYKKAALEKKREQEKRRAFEDVDYYE